MSNVTQYVTRDNSVGDNTYVYTRPVMDKVTVKLASGKEVPVQFTCIVLCFDQIEFDGIETDWQTGDSALNWTTDAVLSEDEKREVVQALYSNYEIPNGIVCNALIEDGVPFEIATQLDVTEGGMQDFERVSWEAFEDIMEYIVQHSK